MLLDVLCCYTAFADHRIAILITVSLLSSLQLRDAAIIKHEDFMEGINVVAAKKKGSLDYYA